MGSDFRHEHLTSRIACFNPRPRMGSDTTLDVAREMTQEDIDEADEILTTHGEPFNREGWQYILNKYDGRLPIRIQAAPEGLVMKNGNVQVQIINTDPKNVPWLIIAGPDRFGRKRPGSYTKAWTARPSQIWWIFPVLKKTTPLKLISNQSRRNPPKPQGNFRFLSAVGLAGSK